MNSHPSSVRSTSARTALKRHRAVVCLAAAGAATLASARAARANDWDGASSADWFNALNWTNPQAVPNAGNIANLLAGYTNAPTIDGAPAAVRGLTIDNSLSPYTVNGTSTISIGAAGISVVGGNTTFNPAINVAAPQTWTVATDTKLVLTQPINGVSPITFAGGGTTDFQFGENNFAGGFVVNNGTLTSTNATDSPSRAFRSNRITLGPGGSLAMTAVSLGSLDTGEIAGTGTLDTFGGGLFLIALGDATFSGTLRIGSTSSGLTVRGIGTQTFTGDTTGVKGPPAVTEGAGLVLAGDAAFLDTSTNNYFARGGHLVLDDSQNNLPNRLNPAANLDGRGSTDNVVQLIGNATATASQTFNNLILNNGALKLKIVHTAGANAATLFNFTGNLNRAGTQAVVDFAATGGVVGGADNGPRFMFPVTGTAGTNGVNLLNGVIATGTGAASSVGFATVNNMTDFAGYSTARGVIAAVSTPFPGSSDATANALVTGSVNTGAAATAFSLNTLKIQPAAAGQTLDVNGAGALSTGGVLLVGPNSFTISSSGGGKVISPGNNTRYYTIADPAATLTISADVASGAPITKAGPGTLFLSGTNTFDAVSGTVGININLLDGVLRATAVSLPNSKTVLRFRGGVFELVGGGLINRQVNNSNAGTNGAVNWFGGNSNDQGSGGFSAFGGSAVVNLDNPATAETYFWGASPSFLSAGYSLVFGSKSADSMVEWQDNINLSGASNVGAIDRFYNVREIRVVDNPAVATDRARMTGAILSNGGTNGGQNADLLKSGDGVLELANANNNYFGNTIVAAGTLMVSGNITNSPNYLLKGGQLTVTGSIPAGANVILSGGGASFSSARVTLGAVSATAGTLAMTPGASANTKVLTASSVALSGTGKIDLNNNAMVLDYAAGETSPIAAVRAALLAGRIASTSASADGTTAIGYVEASSLAAGNRASLLNAGPIAIDDSSIILKYTKAGDATLDGSVNFSDLVLLAQNYNINDGNRVWSQGDFTYDGNINFSDLVKLAQNYNTSLPAEGVPGASAAFNADLAAAFAAVPEPGALSLLGVAACGLAGRRRRRTNAR